MPHRCADKPAWEFSATGTRWRLYHSGELGEQTANTLAGAVWRDEARWSRCRADSEISLLNASSGAWQDVSAETFELLEACEHWRTCTGGVFQPLVGEALAAWGYERSISERAPFAQMGPAQEPVTMRRGSMAGSGSSRDRR